MRRRSSISCWRRDRKDGLGDDIEIAHSTGARIHRASGEFGTMAAAVIVLTATLASAQNLDAGKSPEKLFADGCTACHRSPRGLAKGRYTLTLSWFLQDHYSAGPDTAKALAAYLVSVDTPPPACSREVRRKVTPIQAASA